MKRVLLHVDHKLGCDCIYSVDTHKGAEMFLDFTCYFSADLE